MTHIKLVRLVSDCLLNILSRVNLSIALFFIGYVFIFFALASIAFFQMVLIRILLEHFIASFGTHIWEYA